MFRDDWQWKTSKVFCFLSKAKRGMLEMDGLISSRSPPEGRTNNDLALDLLSVCELYPSLHHSVLVPGRLCVDLGIFLYTVVLVLEFMLCCGGCLRHFTSVPGKSKVLEKGVCCSPASAILSLLVCECL